MTLRRRRAITLLTRAIALACSVAEAQVSGGLISGTGTHSSGAAVPGITIEVFNSATGPPTATSVTPAPVRVETDVVPGDLVKEVACGTEMAASMQRVPRRIYRIWRVPLQSCTAN